MGFAIGKGYVQPRRSPREATVRWAFVPWPRRGLFVHAGRGRSRELEESPGQVICEDFDLAGIGDQNREAHAREQHVDRDAGTGLAADAGDGTFDGRGMCAEHTCVN